MKKALIYVGLYCVSFGFIISMFLVPKRKCRHLSQVGATARLMS